MMKRTERPRDLAARVAERRRQLAERPDVSQKMRDLSASSGQNPNSSLRPKRSPLLTTVMLTAGVFLLVACAVGATALVLSGLWVQNQLSDPPTTAQNFYGALQSQNYTRAYSYTSSGFQKRIPADAFNDQFSSLDQVSGVVDSYPIVSEKTTGDKATVVVHVIRRSNKAQALTQTLMMIKEGNSWRIDNILNGDIVPVSTTTT
ncbi:MAG TPA: hypothetical protein VH349_11220 [Ktedonobacterales bacterium]|jgi:hypothetical protein